MYQASQELFEILKQNGFRDKSFLYVMDYGDRYKASLSYDPKK